MGEYIDDMLIVFLGCEGVQRKANRQDERIVNPSNVDSLEIWVKESKLEHNGEKRTAQLLDPNEKCHRAAGRGPGPSAQERFMSCSKLQPQPGRRVSGVGNLEYVRKGRKEFYCQTLLGVMLSFLYLT